MFKVGDRAVYPAQGVGIIEAIETRQLCGNNLEFYIVRIIDNDMTIMVPVANAGQVGLRRLMSSDKVPSVYDLLGAKPGGQLTISSWSRRQREYNERIKTNNPMEVAQVLRELYLIRGAKELSYGEKKVLDLARRLLVKELALAEGVSEATVCGRLDTMIN